MGRSIAVVKHCKEVMLSCFTKQLVQALVLSQLDYSSVSWSKATETNLNRLQRAQNKADFH